MEASHLSGFTTSFSPDGSTLYIVGGSKALYAVDVVSRQIKWIFGENGIYAAPVVDTDGNIYIMGKPEELANEDRDYLCKLNANGNVLWRFFLGNSTGSGLNLAPTIDKFGNLYFAPRAHRDSIYSVNNDGKLRWKKALEGQQGSPIVCDVYNIVYITVNLDNSISKILAYGNNGDLLWQTNELKGRSGDSPAIGFDILYYNTYRSRNFYAIK